MAVLKPLSLAEILITLRLSRERFEASPNDILTQRECCSISLSAVVAYLHQFPPIAADIEPLAALSSALTKLEGGGRHPLFAQGKKKRGAQPVSVEERNMQAFGVALTELLIDTGVPEQEAVHQVAKSFSDAGLVGSRKRKPITIGVVREWRSIANSGGLNDLRRRADERRSDIALGFAVDGRERSLTRPEAEYFVTRLPYLASLRWHSATAHQEDDLALQNDLG